MFTHVDINLDLSGRFFSFLFFVCLGFFGFCLFINY